MNYHKTTAVQIPYDVVIDGPIPETMTNHSCKPFQRKHTVSSTKTLVNTMAHVFPRIPIRFLAIVHTNGTEIAARYRRATHVPNLHRCVAGVEPAFRMDVVLFACARIVAEDRIHVVKVNEFSICIQQVRKYF